MTIAPLPLPPLPLQPHSVDGAGMSAPAVARNPWVVLISTSLAVFAVFLDTTILFVAFPVDLGGLRRRQHDVAVVGPERVHDRLRRAAHPRRPPR